MTDFKETAKEFIDSVSPLSNDFFQNITDLKGGFIGTTIEKAECKIQELAAATQYLANIEKALGLIQSGNEWHDSVPDLLDEKNLYALASAPKVTIHREGDDETIIDIKIGKNNEPVSVTTTEGVRPPSVIGTMPVDAALVDKLQKIHDETTQDYLASYMMPAKLLIADIVPSVGSDSLPNVKFGIPTPVSEKSVTKSELTPTEKKLHDLVDKIIKDGTPYAWGGGTLEGPSLGFGDDGGDATRHKDYEKVGFDCSALTRYLVYETTGKDIGRVSQDQYVNTVKITDQTKPSIGDLGFPNDKSKWVNNGPGHVVMYMGDGVVVEAPESGKFVKRTIASEKEGYVWHTPR